MKWNKKWKDMEKNEVEKVVKEHKWSEWDTMEFNRIGVDIVLSLIYLCSIYSLVSQIPDYDIF